MNPKTYKINVTNPCSNNWDEMEMVLGGKYCNQCSKTVIDFTTKSEQEIKDYFIKNTHLKICGRFNNNQIDKIIIQFEHHILQSNLKYWQKFLVILLVCFGNQLFATEFIIEQSEITDSLTVQADSIKPIVPIDSIPENTVDSIPVESLKVEIPALQSGTNIYPKNYPSEIFLPEIFKEIQITLGFTTLEPLYPEETIGNNLPFFEPNKDDTLQDSNQSKPLFNIATSKKEKKKEDEKTSFNQATLFLFNNSLKIRKRRRKRNRNL